MSTQRLVWHDRFHLTGTDSWGNAVPIDAEEGSGRGVKPSDMLPISLAACTAYDIVNILRKQRQDLRDLEATIESEQEPEAPWRFTSIAIAYTARGRVDQRKAEKALALSHEKYCSVSATLAPTVRLTFSITVEG